MSRSHFPALNAITFQIAALVEQYEQDVSLLVRGWQGGGDMDLYLRVSRSMDRLRDLCASQPALAVQWVTLLISHTELMHAVWRVSPHGSQPSLTEHLADHTDCIHALAAKCRRLLTESAGEAGLH